LKDSGARKYIKKKADAALSVSAFFLQIRITLLKNSKKDDDYALSALFAAKHSLQ